MLLLVSHQASKPFFPEPVTPWENWAYSVTSILSWVSVSPSATCGCGRSWSRRLWPPAPSCPHAPGCAQESLGCRTATPCPVCPLVTHGHAEEEACVDFSAGSFPVNFWAQTSCLCSVRPLPSTPGPRPGLPPGKSHPPLVIVGFSLCGPNCWGTSCPRKGHGG